jgi:hypothetical protein
MPALPDYMSCHYEDTCTGIECCIEISGLGLTLHPFLLIDPCEYSLSYGVNTINRTIQLINYEWGLYCNSHYLIKAFKRNIPMSFEIKIIALWATNLSGNVDFILLLRCLILASTWRIIRYNPTNFRLFLAADICQKERYLFHLISTIFSLPEQIPS